MRSAPPILYAHTPQGDIAYQVARDGPARALRCAQAIQAVLWDKLQIEIRAGLHTGESERLGDKISGLALHIGARHSEKRERRGIPELFAVLGMTG